MSQSQYVSYNLYIEPYYDSVSNYYHILTINKEPYGPLSSFIKLMSIKNVSTKINLANQSYCAYAIKNSILTNITHSNLQVCTLDDITEVYDFLINNNYIIDDTLSSTLSNYNSKKILLSFKYLI